MQAQSLFEWGFAEKKKKIYSLIMLFANVKFYCSEKYYTLPPITYQLPFMLLIM